MDLVPGKTSILSRPTSLAGPEALTPRPPESPNPRRHQIPGLRSTPYLKIYFLRCDDADTYKASARKLVREWIKSNNLSTAKSGRADQENHDACEWLIVHVAPVDGGAWPTKAHTSVLEKLRSDFNNSSKSAPDHVAQLPFAGDFQVQGATADAVPAGHARDQFVQESNRAWDALLAKMKALILISFDLRVRQYEEDIKERGAQRHLPGWNFCTFFMLKEGLSIGFKSVGLLEDALMGYDELSLELLAAMRQEQESDGGANLFRDHTKDLLLQAEAARSGAELSPQRSKRLSASFIETDYDKPYRELIMANNISVFDFRCYVFTRQVSVLTSMAQLSPEGGARDPAKLAEICRRAVSFITSNTRTVRQDLKISFKAPGDADEAALKQTHVITENLVASWTFSSAQQILKQTEDDGLIRDMDRQPREKKRFRSPAPPQNDKLNAPAAPNRSSSQSRSMSLPIQGDVFSEGGIVTQAQRLNQRKTALLTLASQRARLYALSLSALKTIGGRAGWDHSSTTLSHSAEEMDDVDLNSERGAHTPPGMISNAKYFADSLPNEALKAATASEHAFFAAVEDLSWKTHDLYQYSEDENSVHAIVADIAAIRFYLKDYSSAASYLRLLAPFYAEHEWNDLEVAVLDLYTWCLKCLERGEDYVRVGLKLLGILALRRHRRTLNKESQGFDNTRHATRVNLKDVLEASKALQEPLVIPLQQLFFNVSTSPQITHLDEGDGFGLALNLQQALAEPIRADGIELRLIGVDSTRGREILLTLDATCEIKPGSNLISLVSKDTIPGKFLVDSISVRTANVVFKHQVVPASSSSDPLTSHPQPTELDRLLISQPIMVWPSTAALTTTAWPHPHIRLEQLRSVQIYIQAGRSSVSLARLSLKAGSAGLRLHTAEATIIDDRGSITDNSQAGSISIGAIDAYDCIKVSMPFQLDDDLKEIAFRSDLLYTTVHGTFSYGESNGIGISLPLGVNVQDIFHRDALFSKFSITTSSAIPLRVLDCELDSTRDFEASTAFQDTSGLPVFSKQPVSMVYKAMRARSSLTDQAKLETRMLMHVSYRCLDEEVMDAVRASFSASLLDTETLARYSPLLSAHLRSVLKEHLPRADLNTIALIREYDLPSSAALQWTAVLAAIAESDRGRLTAWLDQWHSEHATIALDDTDASAAAPLRRITIPVDVPAMPVLTTTSIGVAYPPSSSPPCVGEPLPAILTISHTRAWAQDTLPEPYKTAPLTFIYELEVAPDTWLLGGPRRKVFQASEDEEHTFRLTLIPQRAGHLLLPGVEVRAEIPAGGSSRAQAEELQCETHNESIAEAVLVVAGTGEVSVGMAFAEGDVGHNRERLVTSAWVTSAEGWEAVRA